MRKLLLILPILILLILQGCSSMGFDGPPLDTEIATDTLETWYLDIPQEPDKFVEWWNSLTWNYKEDYREAFAEAILLQKENFYISQSTFLILFSKTDRVKVCEKWIEIKGVKIILLKTGKVAKVE